MDSTYSWTFVTGSTGDVKGPIITSASLTLKNNVAEKNLAQKTWSDWSVFQNDRVNAGYNSFKYSVIADDSATGDTGVLRYEVVQRLMYADKGAKLPNGTVLDNATQFFTKDGEWNDILGCTKTDFEAVTDISGDENGLSEKILTLNELFTRNSTDGIYQISLAAVDKLENYSDVPATFYFVRDTTPPKLSTNKENINISGGLTITDGTINGRYIKNANATIKFSASSQIIDEGLVSINNNSLQTASKTVNWKINLSTSNITDTASVTSEYTNANAEEGISLSITDFGQTQTYYPWVYFKDDLGNESEGECFAGQMICHDLTPPQITVVSASEGSVVSEAENSITLYTDSQQTINISVNDSMSGIDSQIIKCNGSDIPWSNTITVNTGKTYTITVTDKVGNSVTKVLTVTGKTAYGSPEIYNLICYDTSEGNIKNKTINYYKDGTRYGQAYLLKYYTNGDVTFEFYASPNSLDNNAYFRQNGIVFENMSVKNYSIYQAAYDESDDSYSYSDENVIISGTNDSNINYVPILNNQISGYIYCKVECIIDISKFEQTISKFSNYSDGVLKLVGASNLKFKVYNDANFTENTFEMGLDTEGPYPIEYKDSFAIYKPAEQNPDGSYTVNVITTNSNTSNDGNGLVYNNIICRARDKLESTDTNISNNAYFVRKDNGDNKYYSYMERFNDVSEGTVFYIVDILGNETKLVFHFSIDTQGPEINVSGVNFTRDGKDNYWTNSENGIEVTFSDEAGFRNCVYSDRNNSYFYSAGANASDTLVLPAAQTGTTYTLTAYDNFGNINTKTFIAGCDTQAPVCTIQSVVDVITILFTPGSDSPAYTYGFSQNGTPPPLGKLIPVLFDGDGISVTPGMSETVIGGYSGYSANAVKDYKQQTVLFSLTEEGSGVSSIEILGYNGTQTCASYNGGTTNTVIQQQYSNKTFAIAGVEGVYSYKDSNGNTIYKSGLSVKVTDMVGNSYTTPIKVTTVDRTPPALALSGSGLKFVQISDTQINVYTGGATSASIQATFSDISGLNPNWTSSFIRGDPTSNGVQYLAKNSRSFTNGEASTFSATDTGYNYRFYSQDAVGNVAEYKLTIYKTEAPQGAVTELAIQQHNIWE